MQIKVVLCDLNPKMTSAWKQTFKHNPEVTVARGSMLTQKVDAWVSPTNARGSMDGGLDAAIKGKLGAQIQKRVQAAIRTSHGAMMPVGHATCVPTARNSPRLLISTPTMVESSEDISQTMNVALACAAAFQAVHIHNQQAHTTPIRSVAMPGLGAGTGRTPVSVCADLMWTAYDLFRWRQFDNFAHMRQALQAILGDLGDGSYYDVKIAAGQRAARQGWGAPAPGSSSLGVF